eukprot:13342473-Ditylum_brightwellii.AAC.2
MSDPFFDNWVTHLADGCLVLNAKGVDLCKWDLWEYIQRERYSIAEVDVVHHEVDQYLLVGRASGRFVVPLFECLV